MNNMRNRVHLIGKLGQNPEIKSFENGKKLATFTIATNESYTNSKGEKVEDTQWHAIKLWDKQAEVAEKYLEKGSEIAVEGKLTYDTYQDKEGVKKFKTEIKVLEFLLLGGNKKS